MSQESPTPAEVLRQLQSRPLCIICGRPSEAEAIATELGALNNPVSGRTVDKINDGHRFFLGSFNVQGQKLEYYITSSLRQGIQSFAIHASILFHILKPRFAVHVGVCAAFYEVKHEEGKEVLVRNLRDVIFGEAAFNYEEGKWEGGDGGDKAAVFKPDFDLIRVPTGDMQAFAESPGRAHYHYGDYISGSAVRHDASVAFKQARANVARNTIALDMEASAFLKLCAYTGVSSLGVVKGISDFGDAGKGEDPNAYADALKKTAIGLREWVIHTIPGVKWELNEDDQKGVAISVGYYDNFVRHVLDAYSMGLSPRKKVTSFEKLPLQTVRGLKIVMPKNMNPEFFAEAGQIGRIMREYKLLEVDIGNFNFTRSLYYKAGYLIDFPRTINSLSQAPDANHQVELFGKRLKQKQYFSSPVHDSDPLAELCRWEDFMKWLEETKVEEMVLPKTVNTENGTAEDEQVGKSAPFLEEKSSSEPAVATQKILESNNAESSQTNGNHARAIEPSNESSPRGADLPTVLQSVDEEEIFHFRLLEEKF
ncbi:phosphorylase superfamily protein [Cadophora sp. MPI-SDFR-AT-0126]|nr:phosphorylase superfamily protein [Leotiomycetes sp. MPI-SDFR-AT-0126]